MASLGRPDSLKRVSLMVRKHLSVRSETSSDVSPLVSIGGRTSTLIFPGNKRRAGEKPVRHRSTVLCPPRPCPQNSHTKHSIPLAPQTDTPARARPFPRLVSLFCPQLPKSRGIHSHGAERAFFSPPSPHQMMWAVPVMGR